MTPSPASSFPDEVASLNRISLEELDSIRLMNRIDTKYILPRVLLGDVLRRVGANYSVLATSDGIPGARYSTTYLDNQSFQAYRSHHNAVPERFKVRIRTYDESSSSFLEVKHRLRSGRAQKVRIGLATPESYRDDGSRSWLKGRHPLGELREKLTTRFNRLTLVDRQRTERVTIDVSLRLAAPDQLVRGLTLDDTAIIEVKQDHFVQGSPMVQTLRSLGIRPSSFSKYCIGAALTYPQLKKNRFKATIRAVSLHQQRN